MHEDAGPRKTVSPEIANALPLFALLGGNIALAFGPWFVRAADVGPIAAGFWRITIAAPILLAIAWKSAPRAFAGARGLGLGLALAGVAFAADLASWHLGILRTTLANSTLFGNSATLMYPIYGFIIARSWPNRTQGLALALAAIGAGLLLGRSYELSPKHLTGDLLCLLAGALYTVYFILMARARETMAPLPALALATSASIVPLLLASMLFGETIWPHQWGVLIGLALVSQVIGQGLMIYALGHLSPLVVGIGLLSQPIVAGAVGWIVYDERLGTPDFIGAGLVAVALVLVRRELEGAMALPPDPTLDEIREALAPAVASNAAFDGWNARGVHAAADAVGLDHGVAELAFADGPVAMIDAWFASIDRAMLERLPAETLAKMKIRERITALLETRLELLAPDREALRRAAAILAMPQNARNAAALGWRAADVMWRAAGDTATDYNHYTKRMTLGAVYASTIAVFLQDESEDWADTRAFLGRRIENVMQFEKTKAQWLGRGEHRLSLSRFIGRLRYPAV